MLPLNDFRMFWREETIRPDGDGFYGGVWVKNSDCSPGSAYTMVDEASSDSDTTFIETDGATGGGHCSAATGPGKESFSLGSPGLIITPNDTILGVTLKASRRRTGGTPASFRVGLRESGTDIFGTAATAPTTFAEEIFQSSTKPSGGAWTLSAVNAAEAIVETTSLCGVCDVRVTQVYVVVEFVIMPADLDIPVGGIALTGAVGSMSFMEAYSLGGVSLSAGPGNLAPSPALAISGNASPAAVGTVVYDDGGAPQPVLQQIMRISINRSRAGISIKGG